MKTSPSKQNVTGRVITPGKVTSFVVRYIIALASCVYLFTIGVLKGRNRTMMYRIASHFTGLDVEPYRHRPELRKIHIADVVPSPEGSINVLEPEGVDGNVTALELIILNRLARKYGPGSVFEIGTFDGRTTLNLAANVAEDAVVYTLDLPPEELESTGLRIAPGDSRYIQKARLGSRFRGTAQERKIRQLHGDSARFDFSPYAGAMDFVFVDGAHSPEYVKNDSLRALAMLRNGRGVIVWHDYNAWEGVTCVLDGLRREDPDFRGLTWIDGTTLAYLVRSHGDA